MLPLTSMLSRKPALATIVVIDDNPQLTKKTLQGPSVIPLMETARE